jgi:hypothetical protein
MSDTPGTNVEVMFARLEAKLDVALAQHGATLDKHAEDIAEVRKVQDDHEKRHRACETRTVITPKMFLGTLGGLAAVVAALTPFLDKIYGS